MSGAIIIAKLIGHDRAQAGDIVARSRSPVNVSWCRGRRWRDVDGHQYAAACP
jgi:hypothetical protein